MLKCCEMEVLCFFYKLKTGQVSYKYGNPQQLLFSNFILFPLVNAERCLSTLACSSWQLCLKPRYLCNYCFCKAKEFVLWRSTNTPNPEVGPTAAGTRTSAFGAWLAWLLSSAPAENGPWNWREGAFVPLQKGRGKKILYSVGRSPCANETGHWILPSIILCT